jgi:hypothetical protein
MRKLLPLLFCFLLLGFAPAAKAEVQVSQLSVAASEIASYRVVAASEGVQLVEIRTKDGKFIWNVIAAIATVFLPEIVEGICTATIGDPDACNVAYQATAALVSLRGVRIYRGFAKSVRYVASRGTYRSTATVEAGTYRFASNVKEAFEVYKKYGCVRWSDVNTNTSQEEEGCYCPAPASASGIFYTNIADCGSISVWVSGKYMGKITKYWNGSAPECGNEGAVTITGEPGTYYYTAEDECGRKWSGSITLEAGQCNSRRFILNQNY